MFKIGAAHTFELEQLRARRARWHSALNRLPQSGRDGDLVQLASESFMLDNECDHLAHEDFSKGDPAKQERASQIVARIWEVREEMAEIPAQSLAGVLAKATVGIEPFDYGESEEERRNDPLRFLLGTLLDDLERMASAMGSAGVLAVEVAQ
jgi:hypothetical protein